MSSYSVELLAVFLSYPATNREPADLDAERVWSEEATCNEDLMVFFSLN